MNNEEYWRHLWSDLHKGEENYHDPDKSPYLDDNEDEEQEEYGPTEDWDA